MRRTTIAVIAIVFLGVAAAFAADAKSDSGSVLISDLTVQPGDSRLVRAAKIAIATRQRQTMHSSMVIDNNALLNSGGHLSTQTSPGAALPNSYYAQTTAQPSSPSGTAPEARAKAEQKVQSLRREQGRMNEEAEQQYANEVDEDLVTKRMTEIPTEINAAQHQLTPPPPPSNPPQ
jgi:hypothetical protein